MTLDEINVAIKQYRRVNRFFLRKKHFSIISFLRPLYLALFVKNFAIGIIVFISVLISACKPSPPPHITDPGQIIYLGYKDTYASCARCHGDEGQGSQQGPDIRNAISDLGRKEVRKIIVFGKASEEYKEEMPAFGEELTPEEIGFVIEFITHWGKSDSTGGRELRDKQ